MVGSFSPAFLTLPPDIFLGDFFHIEAPPVTIKKGESGFPELPFLRREVWSMHNNAKDFPPRDFVIKNPGYIALQRASLPTHPAMWGPSLYFFVRSQASPPQLIPAGHTFPPAALFPAGLMARFVTGRAMIFQWVISRYRDRHWPVIPTYYPGAILAKKFQ